MKLAVVLFNLGGPDGPAAVRPFLANLFRDPAIINLPAMVRLPLAGLIARVREKAARANYDLMGGSSPLLAETETQARALETRLKTRLPEVETQVFIAMRYWTPFVAETAKAVATFAPDELVLLPLYPQFSTTTTASSLKAWVDTYGGSGRSRVVCCYPTASGLVEAHVQAIRATWERAGAPEGLRLLFSAHGLPQRVVDAGDPYKAQIEATAAHIAARLPDFPDWRVCYQSRVGLFSWLSPSTDEEVRRAGAEARGVLVVPVAFVSEHIETLVELDHEYAGLAREVGCRPFLRAPTPTVSQTFIEDLANATLDAVLKRTDRTRPYGPWQCPHGLKKCACHLEVGQ